MYPMIEYQFLTTPCIIQSLFLGKDCNLKKNGIDYMEGVQATKYTISSWETAGFLENTKAKVLLMLAFIHTESKSDNIFLK